MIVQDVYGANAYSPEKVAEQFPELTISQVHMALAYYHDHKAEIDRLIEAEHRFADEMRARHHDPVREQKLIDAAKTVGLIAP
jgi:predicted TIM-barrel fold metal-dependent hydrolase